MTIESIPKLTGLAAERWATIPSELKKLLLSNVWCGKCRQEVTITNFSGSIKKGDLLLEGLCSKCKSEVARVLRKVDWVLSSYKQFTATLQAFQL